jgi:hypothetical protein
MSPNDSFTATDRIPPGTRHYGYMDAYSSSSAPSQRASWVSSLARRICHAASEMHRSTRVASSLMFSYGVAESNRAPDTYAEFLLRLPAAARHEPAARRRAAGHLVR